MKNPKEIVSQFYQNGLSSNPESNPKEVLPQILSDNFISYGTTPDKNKTREQLIQQIMGMKSMIIDFNFEPQEIIEAGNKVIVRSKIVGTPNSPEGHFMGMPTDGSKTFETIAIDIHTVENGKIVCVHHIEDWATAMMQLKSK